MPRNKADVSPSSPQFPGVVERHDQEADVSEIHAGGMAPWIVWDVYRPAATFVGTRSPFPVVLVHGAESFRRYLRAVGPVSRQFWHYGVCH